MSKSLKFALVLSLCAGSAFAQGLGRLATPDEVAAWDIDVRPDGVGLPEGSGTVADGEEVFAERCAVCHGDFGEAVGRWPVLAGGSGTLDSEDPVKTIGSYWPYLSTVWDYVHRAMPFGDAQSLSDDEVYSIVAYLMYLNDIVDDEDFELSRENFLDIPLENEDNFYMDDRAETEYSIFTEACMENCKESVEITARAAVVDVTPEETAARELRQAVESLSNAVETGDEAVTADTTEEAVAEEEAAAPEAAAIDLALAEAGEDVFKKCKACHQVGEGAQHRSGPLLNDLFGRAAGTADGFKYSSDMVAAGEAGLIWDRETLDQFLTKPKDMIKKTKMSFNGLKKEEDRAALIEYLASMQ
ncbi:MAG TPA: c-type cytochrome [Paracoccaceae bacterium]|nr:c-type cytochrome [Paracoccaceae bacterium]